MMGLGYRLGDKRCPRTPTGMGTGWHRLIGVPRERGSLAGSVLLLAPKLERRFGTLRSLLLLCLCKYLEENIHKYLRCVFLIYFYIFSGISFQALLIWLFKKNIRSPWGCSGAFSP